MKPGISIKFEKLLLKILIGFKLNTLDNQESKIGASVLCYHSISKDGWEFSVNQWEFEKQIKYLLENKKILTLKEIINKNETKNGVAITFDDGYADVYEKAFPILKKFKIKAAVFIIGSENSQAARLDNKKKLLSIKQVRELKKEGWEIGFHSVTHANLLKVDQTRLDNEVRKGRKLLEEKLGFKLKYFAYPNGKYDSDVISAVKKAGFEAAFSADGGWMRKNRGLFRLNRIVINNYFSLQEFKAILTPPGLLINAFIEKGLRVKNLILK
jgi:peptidoglycan/xylan/chitin deacetylase (PgdA/CDA1 family)